MSPSRTGQTTTTFPKRSSSRSPRHCGRPSATTRGTTTCRARRGRWSGDPRDAGDASDERGSSMRSGTVLHLIGLLAFLALGGGCVNTSVDRLARHDLSPLPSTTTSVVRETGVFEVKWVQGKAQSGAMAGT